MIIKIY